MTTEKANKPRTPAEQYQVIVDGELITITALQAAKRNKKAESTIRSYIKQKKNGRKLTLRQCLGFDEVPKRKCLERKKDTNESECNPLMIVFSGRRLV